jgi:hypothetical protein
MLKNIHCGLYLILLLLLITRPVSSSEPDTGNLQLELVPKTLDLESCDKSIPLITIVRNQTNHEASELEISSFSDIPVKISDNPSLQALAAGHQILWPLKVKCTSNFASGSLHIVLSDKLKVGDQIYRTEIIVESVEVKLREPQTLESIAAIDIKSTLESLIQTDTGELRVSVTNKTKQPFKVSISPQMPSFIQINPKTINDKEVGALGMASFPFTVSAMERVKPGKQLLIFDVQITTALEKRDVLITREVNVGILGESEMHELLGVPSLLFMPGFLAVSFFIMLWRWNAPMSEDGTKPFPPFTEKDSSFWIVSILISLVIAFVCMKWRGDFFSFYGLNDLMKVWFGSIILGVLAYWVYYCRINYRVKKLEVVKKKAEEQRIKKEHETFPQEDDAPLQILRKLKKHEKTLDNQKVSLNGRSGDWFIVLEDSRNVYVCQPMRLTWSNNADSNLRTTVENELTSGGDPEIIANALEPELIKKNNGEVASIDTLDWVGADSPHVLKLTQTDIEAHLGMCLILDVM